MATLPGVRPSARSTPSLFPGRQNARPVIFYPAPYPTNFRQPRISSSPAASDVVFTGGLVRHGPADESRLSTDPTSRILVTRCPWLDSTGFEPFNLRYPLT